MFRRFVLNVFVAMVMPTLAWSAVDRPGATPAPAMVQVPSPFSWRAELSLPDQPGLYRVPVPLTLYETATRADLGDLRIYNAQGFALPYAWLSAPAQTASVSADVAVPVFALQGAARQNVTQRLAVRVQRDANQAITSVTVDGAPGKGRTEIGSIFDLSKVQGVVRALVFEDYETDTRVHAFSLEGSDDMSAWHTLRQEAHIVRLARDGQVVQQNRVELAPLDPQTTPYLRLRWHSPESAPNLVKVAVRVDAPGSEEHHANFLWTEPQTPASGEDRDFEFVAPAAMPIERLRINLPRANLMAPVRVYAREDTHAADASGPAGWALRAHAVLYRMQADVGEIVSPDVLLPGAPMPRMRVLLDATERLGGTPTVQIGFVPRALVVSIQGPGPYTLAWGAPAIEDGSVPLEQFAMGRSVATLSATLPTLYAQRRESAEGMTVAVPAAPAGSQSAEAAGETGSRTGDRLFTLLLALVDIGLAALAWRAWRRMRATATRRTERLD